MANPRSILKIAISKVGPKEEDSAKHERDESGIVELVERVFTTRNLVHFAHWNTNSYASHMALGDLYDSIVDETDNIVECYQGEFECLPTFETECAKATDDVYATIKGDFEWFKANRSRIACGSTVIENLLDGLSAAYSKTLYKLKNLH